MRSIDNPFRVVNRWLLNTQGSALARATLGWNLQTPSALVLHWNSRTSSALPWAGICKRLRRWSCTGIREPLRRCPGLEFANAFGVNNRELRRAIFVWPSIGDADLLGLAGTPPTRYYARSFQTQLY